MNLLLDTNRLSDALRGKEEVLNVLEAAHSIHIPFVALAEAHAGFLAGTKGPQNLARLQRLLTVLDAKIRYGDRGTIDTYAQLFAQLRAQRVPIPSNDLWIAALALQHNLVLYTRDEHFARLPQISRL
jgi:tRNA(fMet)-specific endonuclease VapC